MANQMPLNHGEPNAPLVESGNFTANNTSSNYFSICSVWSYYQKKKKKPVCEVAKERRQAVHNYFNCLLSAKWWTLDHLRKQSLHNQYIQAKLKNKGLLL